MTTTQAAVLEADITLVEMQAALKLCARKAAPGVTVSPWISGWRGGHS